MYPSRTDQSPPAVHFNGVLLEPDTSYRPDAESPWPARWQTVEILVERVVGCVVILMFLDAVS